MSAPSAGAPASFAPARLAELDQHALNAPKAAEGSVKDLAAYLAQPARDDFEKTRTIYRWIAQNIAYDVKAFFSKQYGDQSTEAVLRRRTGVCEGYANLFQALARAAGVEVVKVSGWAKGLGYDTSELYSNTNHAWNAIKVGTDWYLIDSTWGAGHTDESREFVREFNDYYWLAPPRQLIHTHFPEDSRWQLLSPSVNKASFAALPELKPHFFDLGLQLPPGTIAVTQVDTRIALNIAAPSDVLLTAAIEQGGSRLPKTWVFSQRDGGVYEVNAVFPGPGEYDLLLFAKRPDNTDSYPGVAVLTFEVKTGEPSFRGFPDLKPDFFNLGLQLPLGTTALTQADSRASLNVTAPSDILMTAAIEKDGVRLPKTLVFLQRSGNISEVQAVFPGPGKYDLLLFAKRPDNTDSYPGVAVLTYEVKTGEPAFPGFPTTYAGFQKRGGYLYYPLQSKLPVGSTQTFKLRIPDAQDAAVVIGKAWTHLDRQGDVFEGSAAIGAGQVQVCARFDGGAMYDCLVSYND